MRKVLILAGLFVAGCATVSQMTPTSGSRADGIVKLSYEYGMFDKVQIDQASALASARKRCATWGYGDAEPFGGVTRHCQAMGSMGCLRWFATVEYQCTSPGGSAAPPLVDSTLAPRMSAAPADGPRKVRAKTKSGYCLDVPADYIGTGSEARPIVNSAMPRCSSLSAN
jgi:hypothetical protein